MHFRGRGRRVQVCVCVHAQMFRCECACSSMKHGDGGQNSDIELNSNSSCHAIGNWPNPYSPHPHPPCWVSRKSAQNSINWFIHDILKRRRPISLWQASVLPSFHSRLYLLCQSAVTYNEARVGDGANHEAKTATAAQTTVAEAQRTTVEMVHILA